VITASSKIIFPSNGNSRKRATSPDRNDTEVIAHLIENYYLKTGNRSSVRLEEAVPQGGKELTGVSRGVIAVDTSNKIVAPQWPSRRHRTR